MFNYSKRLVDLLYYQLHFLTAITVFFHSFFPQLFKNLFLPFWDVANIKERYISFWITLKECEKNKILDKLQKSWDLLTAPYGLLDFCILSRIFSFFHTFLKVWIKKNTIFKHAYIAYCLLKTNNKIANVFLCAISLEKVLQFLRRQFIGIVSRCNLDVL